MADAPMVVWLHLGPQAQASVSVVMIGTNKTLPLSAGQARRLHHALGEGLAMIAADGGDRPVRTSHNLPQGVDA